MIRDISLSLVTRILVIVAGVLTSILTARTLGVVGRGEYFYVMTLANLATQFGSLGLASSNTFMLAKDHSLLGRLAANSFWVSLLLGLVASLIALFFHKLWSERSTSTDYAWVIVIMVPAMIYGLLASNLLIGFSKIRLYNLFQIGTTALQLTLVALSAYLIQSVNGFLVVSAFASLVVAAVAWKLLARLHAKFWRCDWHLLQSNLGYAGRAYITTLLGFAVSRAGVFLLERFTTKAEVGIYSIAVQFADMLIIVPATVAMVLFPELLRGPVGQQFSRTIQALIRVALMMIVLCTIIGAAAIWVVPVVFGAVFGPSIKVLWCMLPGVFALSLANIVSQYLAANGIPASNIWAWFFSLIFFLASGSQFIPRWGAVGAATSLSLAYILLTIMLILLAYRRSALETQASI